MELTKGRIVQCIGDPDLLRRMVRLGTDFGNSKYIFTFIVYYLFPIRRIHFSAIVPVWCLELINEFLDNISLALKISIFEKYEMGV